MLEVTEGATDDIVISKVNHSPYSLPSGFDSVFQNQYWIIHRYDEGNISSKVVFSPSENLNKYDEIRPEFFVLMGREAHQEGIWSVIDTASTVNNLNNEITFDIIPSYNQLVIVRTDHFDCVSDVIYENTTAIPDITGSDSYIKLGNINGVGEVRILSDQNKTLIANDEIELLSGFIVDEGALLEAIIEKCPE